MLCSDACHRRGCCNPPPYAPCTCLHRRAGPTVAPACTAALAATEAACTAAECTAAAVATVAACMAGLAACMAQVRYPSLQRGGGVCSQLPRSLLRAGGEGMKWPALCGMSNRMQRQACPVAAAVLAGAVSLSLLPAAPPPALGAGYGGGLYGQAGGMYGGGMYGAGGGGMYGQGAMGECPAVGKRWQLRKKHVRFDIYEYDHGALGKRSLIWKNC